MHQVTRLRTVFQGSRKNIIIAAVAAMAVGIAGLIIVKSGASGYFAATDAGNGTVATNATIITDNSTSSGKAVQFNAPPAPPPPPPPTGGGGTGGTGGGSPGPLTCPPYPAMPTPSCTGWQHTGVTLTAVNSLYYATTPGEVLDSKEFKGGIRVEADNVTIKRSLVEGKDSGPGAGIWIDAGVSGTLVEDVEITSLPGADPSNDTQIVDRAITGSKTNNLTIRRVYAHRMIRGLEYGCNNTLIEDSYVDDEINPSDAHMSAIGGESCSTFNLTVRHNNIGLAPNVNDSSTLLFYPPQVGAYGSQVFNVLYENNLIYGGTYCLWISSDPQFSGTLTVRNNQFGTKYYSACGRYNTHFKDNTGTEGSLNVIWTNNTWYAPSIWNTPPPGTQDGQAISF